MQKTATKLFIYSSVAFGIIGILLVLIGGPDEGGSLLNQTLRKLLLTSVFIILPSFALSVAGKYLKDSSR